MNIDDLLGKNPRKNVSLKEYEEAMKNVKIVISGEDFASAVSECVTEAILSDDEKRREVEPFAILLASAKLHSKLFDESIDEYIRMKRGEE